MAQAATRAPPRLDRPVGRPKADPHELDRLRAEKDKLEAELATARSVIEVESFRAADQSSPQPRDGRGEPR
ncbi:hypothetical protein HBB16_19390 [Pseudonocardia sp. MCCB 268]|nr:hypothetical protein [Pseudonocardia cytotoxica]